MEYGNIVFSNLIEANSEVVVDTADAEQFEHPNAKGILYQPNNREDVSARALKSAQWFRETFQ